MRRTLTPAGLARPTAPGREKRLLKALRARPGRPSNDVDEKVVEALAAEGWSSVSTLADAIYTGREDPTPRHTRTAVRRALARLVALNAVESMRRPEDEHTTRGPRPLLWRLR